MTNQASFFWHDYETFGISPANDRPSQFAGIRTDMDLNIIGDPLELYCRPPSDYLPQPEACLLTGITPQQALAKGVNEAEFIRQIHQAFSQPGTCVVGYNNIRFDDEVTRFCLYRNFYDPYAREWQNGNSRWDILDMVRACYALRPEGINWVYDDEGKPKFKLELLTQANGISHQDAHDAVADVIATIEMAKLIKNAQPKLFQYLFSLRDKKEVSKLIDVVNYKPLVHISGMFSPLHGCASYVVPLSWHPTNKNAVILVDLNQDVSPLFDYDADTLREHLYTKTLDLPEGISRPPLKLLHINKCPVLAPAKTLTEQRADELGIDRELCRQSLNRLQAAPELREKLLAIYQQEHSNDQQQDPDRMLYTGGFFSRGDKASMDIIRDTSPDQLTHRQFQFEDSRLAEMLFRYRARNFPDSLNKEEMAQWQLHREQVLGNKVQSYVQELESLALVHQENESAVTIIKSLYDYVQTL